MMFRILAVALLASACGTVADKPATDASVGDAAGPGSDGSVPAAVMWEGKPSADPSSNFGGNNMFCNYTITLKQLDVQLAILPSGVVTSGQVQDLNVEAIVPSTTPFVCTATSPGTIPPNIATYKLATAVPSASGATLTFQGDATNMPPASLEIDLTKVNSMYSATLKFHRNDGQPAVLLWMVMAMLTLTPK